MDSLMTILSIFDNFINSSIYYFFIRLFVNLLVDFILIRIFYYRSGGKPEFIFSFFLIGTLIFLICSALELVKIQLGVALGLFAIFGIVRFRTRNVPIKEMTYIFVIIGLSAINALAEYQFFLRGTFVVNGLIIILIAILENFLDRKTLTKQRITYENIQLLKPGMNKALIEDLNRITGFDVRKVEIRNVDYTRNLAIIDIFYKNPDLTS
jgi:hypothetical protein